MSASGISKKIILPTDALFEAHRETLKKLLVFNIKVDTFIELVCFAWTMSLYEGVIYDRNAFSKIAKELFLTNFYFEAGPDPKELESKNLTWLTRAVLNISFCLYKTFIPELKCMLESKKAGAHFNVVDILNADLVVEVTYE